MADVRQSYILDGFPRTISQRRRSPHFRRPMRRWTLKSGMTSSCSGLRDGVCAGPAAQSIHAVTKPPKVDGICDLCGGELYTRNDDREETVKVRLRAYHEETEPLIDYYAGKGRSSPSTAAPTPKPSTPHSFRK